MDSKRWDLLLQQQRDVTAARLQDDSLEKLLYKINTYVQDLHTEIQRLRYKSAEVDHTSKKRKLDQGGAQTTSGGNAAAWLSQPFDLAVPDVSFSAPSRKKMRIELAGGFKGGLRAMDQKTGAVESSIDWKDIDQIISVPVPEKAQPTQNFLFIPHDHAHDALVFTLSNTAARSFQSAAQPSVRAPTLEHDASQPEALTRWITTCSAGRHAVVEPSEEEFLSNLTQPHRSAVKPAHSKAFRGSKDGFLFFLAPGIVFGFRKPILWFPFDRIISISYTSVLQRTFNMVISARGVEAGKGDEEEVEYEFAMLDQVDFAGIDAYVKRHGLQDASLAEARRAKRYGVNDTKRARADADANGNGISTGHDVIGEQIKTEQQIQDEEDELEEDFDPGSDGESDGSGTDSEDGEGNYAEDAP